jgi:hypothetical protein
MKNFLLLFLFIPGLLQAQNLPGNYITTVATIKSVEFMPGGRSSRYVANVEFIDNQKDSVVTRLNLFLGFWRKEGRSINIKYNASNPYIAYPLTSFYVQGYGLYVLILIGIISSYFTWKKRKNKAATLV